MAILRTYPEPLTTTIRRFLGSIGAVTYLQATLGDLYDACETIIELSEGTPYVELSIDEDVGGIKINKQVTVEINNFININIGEGREKDYCTLVAYAASEDPPALFFWTSEMVVQKLKHQPIRSAK